jgi:hypothetical protein
MGDVIQGQSFDVIMDKDMKKITAQLEWYLRIRNIFIYLSYF